MRSALLLVVALVTLAVGPPQRGEGQAGWPEVTLTPVGPEFGFITEITTAGDGSGRLYVVEKAGTIRILLPGGGPAASPFLDISASVRSSGSEQGLLGLAFSPGFAEDRTFYVNYTDTLGDTVVARFLAHDALDADEGSGLPVLEVDQPAANHNGGHLAFGPDGWLYIGMGDGGGAGDPNNHAQRDGDPLGKLLRYDPATGTIEDWAKGLRNPWKFSFDRLTADLYIADVGQNEREELNFVPAGSGTGLNFGWRRMEGSSCYPPGSECDSAGLILPVYEYSHAVGCSITGGYVSRKAASGLDGIYLFSDFCTGGIHGLRRGSEGRWEHALLAPLDGLVSTFGEGDDGTLYVAADVDGWRVFEITAPLELPPLAFRVAAPGIAADR